MLAEQADVFQQQIAEIGGVEDFQPLLIAGVEFAALAVAEHRGFAAGNLRRSQAAVFPAVDQSGQHPRRPALVVDVLGLQQLLQQPDLIVDIEHGEVRFELHQFGMDTQDAAADRVEGAEPRHAFDGLAEHLAEPVLHLARRLVGEGHRQDLVRPCPALAQDVGDAGGQHAGLAGAGAGQHQNRSVQRDHRLALLRVEAGEILRTGRGPRTRGDAASRRLVLGDAVMGRFARLGHSRIVLSPRWHRGAMKGSLHSRDYGPYRA